VRRTTPKNKITIILPRISHSINSPILQLLLMRGLLPCGTTLCDSDTNLGYDSETKFRQSGRTIRSPHLPSREEDDLIFRMRQREKRRRGEWMGKRSRDRPPCTRSLTRENGTWLLRDGRTGDGGGPKILQCEPPARFTITPSLPPLHNELHLSGTKVSNSLLGSSPFFRAGQAV
jgi:hypothetical protein